MSFDVDQPSDAELCEVGHEFEPKYPGSTVGIGAKITVRGPHSEMASSHHRQHLETIRARAVSTRRNSDSGPSLDELNAQLVAQAVACTITWSGMARGKNGPPVPFSPEAARALYTRQTWLRDQVNAQADDLGNFIKLGSPSSTPTPPPSSAST